jgi:CDP-diglyceride synthetase
MGNRKPHTLPPSIIYCFFALGIISAIAFRAIIVFQRLEPSWVRPVWYVGVIGYMVFFLYRYYISEKRKKAIENFQLIEKLKANACLTDEDREVVIYLLSSVRKSPENVNYFIIFLLSILAIIADIYFTLAG